MTTFSIKFGRNRGKRRVWLEGKRLANEGWIAKETTYVVMRRHLGHNQRPVLTLHRSGNGDKRVSGKGDKPIIDICTVWLEGLFGAETERLEVSITHGAIDITLEG